MKENLLFYFKGIAIGLADLVPGVSGGTIALLAGIYPRFIGALAKADFFLPGAFFSEARRKHYDIYFLSLIVLGALTGILAGAQLIHYLLQNFSPPLFAFFAGIICAAIITTVPSILRKNALMFILGLVIGLGLSFSFGVFLAFHPIYIFLAGFLAACVMLLPGISGSFLLLLLGIYRPLIEAIVAFDWIVMLVFASGVLLGVLSFSRLLNLLFARHHKVAMASMFGLMTGALPRLWPWQAQEGDNITLLSPYLYETSLIQPPYLAMSLLTFSGGILMVFVLRRFE